MDWGQILGDGGLELGRPKEEMSPKAPSLHVRHRGREISEKRQRKKYQRNGKHLRYLIMENLSSSPAWGVHSLYFEQGCGDSQPGDSPFSNTSKLPQVEKEL